MPMKGAMASSELRHTLMLEPASSFEYLNQSGCYTLEGVDDAVMFDQLRLALQVFDPLQHLFSFLCVW